MNSINEKAVWSRLTNDERELLLECLFNQKVAIDIVSAEISDMECERKQLDELKVKQLSSLYYRLCEEVF
ncbi:antirepressor AbbA [Bacillus sp. HMF5848]|uniref:antirepressor AbbA n=1 Tax=Bacillus sp. HMF5848 TaxID=2495421 RepID=UPI000F7AE8FF|nr:antirepressor AbbA [Bacillus sp. HMF5848]RSK26849.1 antirepressor AbbA [Bacillus sp. HMF5848]